MLDLGLVVADKNMDFALRGILGRPPSLGIRPISYRTVLLPGRDGGVRTIGPEALARLRGEISHGIIMLDREGSSAFYQEVTSKVSLARCVDPAFLRLRTILRQWFA